MTGSNDAQVLFHAQGPDHERMRRLFVLLIAGSDSNREP